MLGSVFLVFSVLPFCGEFSRKGLCWGLWSHGNTLIHCRGNGNWRTNLEDNLASSPNLRKSQPSNSAPGVQPSPGEHTEVSVEILTQLHSQGPNREQPSGPRLGEGSDPLRPSGVSLCGTPLGEDSESLEDVIPGCFLPPLKGHMLESGDIATPCM